ncbi:MAG: LysM peptidoglycan-binding domain-containing protein [Anaerolineales bacterium]|jgi:nucleoid-associated protein YgaU
MEKTNKPQEEKKGFQFDPKKSGIVESYTVKQGDTLSKIAEKIYGDGSLYTKIYDANKAEIGSNPDQIKVGMTLKIPPK